MLLYHHWLSAGSRKARLTLAEKKLEYEARLEQTWRRNEAFLALNPAGEVPVLVIKRDPRTGAPYQTPHILSGSQSLCEYLDEVCEPGTLLGLEPESRAEVRRLTAWFDVKFRTEAHSPLVDEKVTKRLMNLGAPDTERIRAGKRNLHIHLSYIAWLMERRNWLAGQTLSLADLTAAAALSCIDYLGDVPWDEHPAAKDWYARIKSRPSFRPLLTDRLPGIEPPRHYADLDF